MKKIIYLSTVATFSFILTGCQTPSIESLAKLNPEINAVKIPLAKKVCLRSWIDKRKTINNYGLWNMCPLVPYSNSEFQYNEHSMLNDSRKKGSLKKAMIKVYSEGNVNAKTLKCKQLENDVLLSLAKAIHKSHIFKKENHDHNAKAEYTIQPVLLKWKEKNWITTYMIGYCGPLLWTLGLPYGEKHWETEIVLILKETKSGESLLVKNYSTKTSPKLIGIPFLFGWCFNYRDTLNYSFEAQDLAPFFTKSIADFVISVEEALKRKTASE